MPQIEPYTNPFDPISVTVSIVAFVIHIALLLMLGVLSFRTAKSLTGISKLKMRIIAVAFLSLGTGDTFYFLMFLTFTLIGTTGYSIAIGSTVIYPCTLLETLFRIFAIIFLVAMYSYSAITDKPKSNVYGMIGLGIAGIILQLFPQNYFSFRYIGDGIYLRPYSDVTIVIIAVLSMLQSLLSYLRARKETSDLLVRRKKFAFFTATILVSFGIIGVIFTGFFANIDMLYIYIILGIEIFILIAPSLLYYTTIFASQNFAKKVLRVK